MLHRLHWNEPTQQSHAHAGQVDTEYVRLADARAIGGQPEPCSRLFASPVFPFRVGSGMGRHTCPSPSSFGSLLALIADGLGRMLECVRACSCCRLGSCRSPRLPDAAATHREEEGRACRALLRQASPAWRVPWRGRRKPLRLAPCPRALLPFAYLRPCLRHASGQRCARPGPLPTVGGRTGARALRLRVQNPCCPRSLMSSLAPSRSCSPRTSVTLHVGCITGPPCRLLCCASDRDIGQTYNRQKGGTVPSFAPQFSAHRSTASACPADRVAEAQRAAGMTIAGAPAQGRRTSRQPAVCSTLGLNAARRTYVRVVCCCPSWTLFFGGLGLVLG